MTLQQTSPRGLSTDQAALALAEHGPNTIPAPRPPSAWRRVLVQLRDPMILLLIAAAVLTAGLRDFTDLAVILVVVVLNTTVGVVQEIRAEHALAALSRLAAPHATVRRDGRATLIASAEVVPNDVVLLQAGDVVPADLQVFDAAQLQADESTLTGESVPVEKDTADQLYAGTVVTRGRGTGLALRTGSNSALGKIAALLSGQRPRATPLQRRLASLSRVLSIVAVSLSAIVAVAGLIRGLPLPDMVVTAVSLTVAAVPESLPAVVTLALAIGAHRMAQRAAVVRKLPAVETLGAVTIVATDKTGTLTQGIMQADRLWTECGWSIATGTGYDPAGDLRPLADRPADRATVRRLLRDVALCNDAALRLPTDDDPVWRAIGDPTEAALLTLAHRGAVDPDEYRAAYPRTHEVPFDSTRKRMTTFHEQPGRDDILVIGKGAPEVMLTPDVTPYGDITRAKGVAAELSEAGYRVLAVADKLMSPGGPRTEDQLHLAGLIAITDPLRHNAADVVAAFGRAGIGLLLITGDAPGTALAVADRIGVHDGDVVTGADIDDGKDPTSGHVFARIRPEQKLDIVSAWQDAGHVVAMTGDGVNDAPALRRADIGVAMGQGGTEVARQAADLVLTDDDLGTVEAAIEEGRRIYTNIRTFLRYALSGGLAEVLVMLVGPLLGFAVPLLPAQILWINMLTHGVPGVAIGAEPADPETMRQPPRSPQEQVLGAGLWQRIAWTGTLIAIVTLVAASWTHHTGGPWQTMAYLVLGLAQLGVALALRRPGLPGTRRRPRFLDTAVAGALLLQVLPLFVTPLRNLLGLQLLSAQQFLVALGLAVVPALAIIARRTAAGRRHDQRTAAR
ncbi:cation-translocating P-type ATPase [Kribbella sindirgiensis]|uniref:Cation-transporting P-type ATPase n=1 Tax=Kribbella sindirgiensis TaxID=1124744 RepID=A0A4R0I199_9ACTN|nr:cation-transporting P-type ATPase [Kribbella sindirgiensis]TCC16057.1 cation-transporting P-type ATPase [Kribbella sindirgiensis]